MAQLLLGKPVAEEIRRRLTRRQPGCTPTLAVVEVGDGEENRAYVRGIVRQAELVGACVDYRCFPPDTSVTVLLEALDNINADPGIHGCLLLRPLPAALRPWERLICSRLRPEKDLDGMADGSMARLYSGQPAFAPCTAQACMELLDFYHIPCRGRHAVILGRSLVVGRPLCLLLLARDATVTLCHSKTENLSALARQGDLLISAAGKAGLVTADFTRRGQVVLDVSINPVPGGLTGDAAFDQVEPLAGAITPVPGGVGSVTTAVLLEHLFQAAAQ